MVMQKWNKENRQIKHLIHIFILLSKGNFTLPELHWPWCASDIPSVLLSKNLFSHYFLVLEILPNHMIPNHCQGGLSWPVIYRNTPLSSLLICFHLGTYHWHYCMWFYVYYMPPCLKVEVKIEQWFYFNHIHASNIHYNPCT